MNPERFKQLFPRASADTIRKNTDGWTDSPTLSKGDVLYDTESKQSVKITDENNPDTELQSPEPERDQATALGATGEGKEKSVGRVTVRFVGYRCRPLDPDNFAGGCKDLLDGLRHAGLIRGDEPWRIIFQTEQVKVNHRGEERTQIILDYNEPV